MALPTSGPLSIQDIRIELDNSSGSLATLSQIAGFSQPYAISDFYGYSNVTTSDITVARYISGTAAYVRITSSSFEQGFSSPYVIGQGFTVNYYNYVFGYSFNRNYYFNFSFNNTASGSLIAQALPSQQNSVINYGFANGTPSLSTNGNPVNLTGWS